MFDLQYAGIMTDTLQADTLDVRCLKTLSFSRCIYVQIDRTKELPEKGLVDIFMAL